MGAIRPRSFTANMVLCSLLLVRLSDVEPIPHLPALEWVNISPL